VEYRADQLRIEDIHRQFYVRYRLGLKDIVLKSAFDNGVSVFAADKGPCVCFLPQQAVGKVFQVINAPLDMALQVAVHIDHRFLDFPSVELVSTPNSVKKLRYFHWSISGKDFCLFLVNEIPDFLYHFVFSRYHVTVEHILVILVEVVIQLFFNSPHDIKTF